MGKFYGNEIKKTPTKLTDSIVSLPSGSFLKLGGQAYNLTTNLQASLLVSGLGGVEVGSIVPVDGVMFLFVVRSGGVNYLTLSSNNTSTYPLSSFVGFVQINNSIIFDVYSFDTQTPTKNDTTYTPASTGGLNIGTFFTSIFNRYGSRLYINVAAITGTVDGNTAIYSLPPNLRFSNLLQANAGVFTVVGVLERKINSAPNYSVIALGLENAFKFGLRDAGNNNIDNSINALTLLSNSEDIYFNASVPIEGWHDNLQDLLG